MRAGPTGTKVRKNPETQERLPRPVPQGTLTAKAGTVTPPADAPPDAPLAECHSDTLLICSSQDSPICGQTDGRTRKTHSRGPKKMHGVGGKPLPQDKCTRTDGPVRTKRKRPSADGPFSFLFDIPAEGVPPRQ